VYELFSRGSVVSRIGNITNYRVILKLMVSEGMNASFPSFATSNFRVELYISLPLLPQIKRRGLRKP
jgi:hypothetical protein